MSSSTKHSEQPFVDEGGIRQPPDKEADPFRALDELMVVVEALCPEWPPRESFTGAERMLL